MYFWIYTLKTDVNCPPKENVHMKFWRNISSSLKRKTEMIHMSLQHANKYPNLHFNSNLLVL